MSTNGVTVDVRFEPTYELLEAARYIHVSHRTMRNWFCATKDRPVLELASRDHAYVSFIGLVEAHVLSSTRIKHGVPLQRVRGALDNLKKRFNSAHPLAEFNFQTDGLDLFIEEIGALTKNRYGRISLRDVFELHLSRIDRGDDGLPVRLYPFTHSKVVRGPRIIVIDPKVSFGRPMIRRTCIATSAVAQRFKSGESIASLAADFKSERSEIEAAIRSELIFQSAA